MLEATHTPTPTVVPTATVAPSPTPDASKTVSPIWDELKLSPYVGLLESAYPCALGVFRFEGDLHEHFLEWTPDGSSLVFAHGTTIQTIYADGSRPQLITDVNPGYDLGYGIHADLVSSNSKIIYTTCRFPTAPPSGWRTHDAKCPSVMVDGIDYYDRVTRHYEIATSNIDGTETRRLTDNIHLDHYPEWSPDGTRIAFISNSQLWLPESGQLYTMAADGSDVRLVTPSLDTVALYPPVWSPDGQHIAFVVREGKGSRVKKVIYTIGSDGSDLTRVSETVSLPSWSPDGLELAFSIGGEEGGVYAAYPDGTGIRLIASIRASVVSWSPDGNEILFVGGSVYVAGADGNGLRTILIQDNVNSPWLSGIGTRSPIVVNASWSPDGSQIAILMFYEDGGTWWRTGYYSSPGRVVTVARDGTDLRTLLWWQLEDPIKYQNPGRLVAGNREPVDALQADAPCASEVVIPDPESNTGLVMDCKALLSILDTFTIHTYLNWSSDLPLTEWEGVTVGGSPARIMGLALREYDLSGPIPSKLGDLTAIEQLDLGGNYLDGNIPPDLSSLTELRALRLDNNTLQSGVPRELGRLANLHTLDLSHNRLTGSVPPELGQLSNLRALNLERASLTGTIPAELGQLSNLRTLNLAENALTGAIPPELGQLSNLRTLNLAENALTGAIPPELGQLSNLRTLNLAENALTGAIPPELGRLVNLHTLNLGGRQMLNQPRSGLSDTIPPELGQLSNLRTLNLAYNKLTSAVPSELGRLVKLHTLDLRGNALTGAIPSELGRLVNLQTLSLADNKLTGAIPSELGGLINLQTLSLFANELTGSIPPELGNLASLQYLYLFSNQLTGSIPPELGKLKNLCTLWLNDNKLSGCIPNKAPDMLVGAAIGLGCYRQ